jgi:hypothetical protein
MERGSPGNQANRRTRGCDAPPRGNTPGCATRTSIDPHTRQWPRSSTGHTIVHDREDSGHLETTVASVASRRIFSPIMIPGSAAPATGGARSPGRRDHAQTHRHDVGGAAAWRDADRAGGGSDCHCTMVACVRRSDRTTACSTNEMRRKPKRARLHNTARTMNATGQDRSDASACHGQCPNAAMTTTGAEGAWHVGEPRRRSVRAS